MGNSAMGLSDKELAFTAAHQLNVLIRQKKVSPVEVLDAIFSRVEAIDLHLNAFLSLAKDEAYSSAREAERAVIEGEDLGPLHGIPISIKDLIEVKSMPTTFGFAVLRNNIPKTEGLMIRRLRKAGAIIIGKTNTPEAGLAVHTENKLAETRNPWNADRTPGGSSGGAAAAVAAGISPLAVGTDGGGSIRIPASLSGIYGLKPTNGRVPLDVKDWGVNHVLCLGPLTRNVRDAAMLLNVMAGPDKSDYTCIRTPRPDYLKELDGKTKRLRIAASLDLGYGVRVEPEVASAFENAVKVFESLGHSVEEAAPKTIPPFDLYDINVSTRVFFPFGFLFEEHPDELTDYAKFYLELARESRGVDVAKSWIEVEKIRGYFLDFFEEYNLLVTPTTAVTAFKIGQRDKSLGKGGIDWAFCPFTATFNLSRNPAASVPCGFSSQGLPIGLQIVGRLEEEVTVLQASLAFEQVRPWADNYPPFS
jgi:aspartyl-tRNA(Asn)/glutamyl-tRNA(Gln) amidotransferase subunit A